MRFVRHVLLLSFTAALAAAQTTSSSYQPITGGGRFEWAIMNTINLPSFGVGLVNSGWGTYFNEPREYGTSLKGFGKRFGIRLTGIATSNTMEAGLGAVWGEDPRYARAEGQSFRRRAGHVVQMTFMARNREGRVVPAYARYAAIGGSNFLSNAWRADSDATADHAAIRIGLGFLGRLGVNTYYEFWPDVKAHFFRP
ncbi:MAG TPA: hypothetical protein VEV17_10465 [Bryobacteraceae bacterium]|nr:hypothetical protein [Bryobacteraceae bacterium]